MNRLNALWITALILCAFALRMHRLDSVPLRGDEAYSVVHWTAEPFTDEWKLLLEREPAPVGAFTMFWAWTSLTGTSEFALRLLSVLGNIIGLAVIISLSHRLLDKWRIALLIGVMWAVHPFLIWHAQDARVYGVLSALSPLSFYWLLRTTEDDKRSHWAYYIFFQTLAIYVYYFEPFWLLAQGLYVLWLGNKHIYKQAFRAWVIIGILSIPVIIQLYTLIFISTYEGNAADASFTLLFSQFLPTLYFGFNTIPVWVGVIIVSGLILGLRYASYKDARMRLILLWIIVPPLVLYAISFTSSFFRPRYVTTITPALIIVPVAIIIHIVPDRWRKHTLTLFTLIIVSVSVVEVRDYFYHDPPKAFDWPTLTSYLESRTTKHDVIITDAIDPALNYYYQGDAFLYFTPTSSDNPKYISPEQLLDKYHAQFVLSGTLTVPITDYLDQNAQYIPGDTWPGLVQYRNWEVEIDEIQHPLNIIFGEVATLRGYSILGDTALMLYWEAMDTTETDYSVMVHLKDAPDVPAMSVLDHGVANSVISTRTWSIGTLYRDPIAIPPDLPTGEYTILTGLYETATGEPLMTKSGETQLSIGLVIP